MIEGWDHESGTIRQPSQGAAKLIEANVTSEYRKGQGRGDRVKEDRLGLHSNGFTPPPKWTR